MTDDGTDPAEIAIGHYVEAGGTVVVDTFAGQTRVIDLTGSSTLPVGVRRVRANGTTAIGIDALLLA